MERCLVLLVEGGEIDARAVVETGVTRLRNAPF